MRIFAIFLGLFATGFASAQDQIKTENGIAAQLRALSITWDMTALCNIASVRF